MAKSGGERSRDDRAPRSGGARQGGRSGGAPARKGAAAKRGVTRRDTPALPLLGPDDERPYPKAGDLGAKAPGRPRRPLGDRAGSGVRARGDGRKSGDRRADARKPADRGRTQGRDGARRGGRGREEGRKAGEVTGPFTRKRQAPVAPKEDARPVLRIAGKRAPAGRDETRGETKRATKGRTTKASPGSRSPAPTTGTKRDGSAARRRRRPTEATEELRRLAGGNANRATDTLERASEAFARGRERDALRILRPLTEAYPKAAAVRELAGLCRYRIGSYAAAADDLAAFAELSGSTEQHPVLMDCRRAQGRLRDVETLWEELRETSPSAALVTEGRIVFAGALADKGKLTDAIDLLERRAQVSGRVHEHIVRLWYALADLEERAGNVPRARALFEQVRSFDSSFADVAERLAALS